jgi:hypothetical protein
MAMSKNPLIGKFVVIEVDDLPNAIGANIYQVLSEVSPGYLYVDVLGASGTGWDQVVLPVKELAFGAIHPSLDAACEHKKRIESLLQAKWEVFVSAEAVEKGSR